MHSYSSSIIATYGTWDMSVLFRTPDPNKKLQLP